MQICIGSRFAVGDHTPVGFHGIWIPQQKETQQKQQQQQEQQQQQKQPVRQKKN